jgi:hypothetical protein
LPLRPLFTFDRSWIWLRRCYITGGLPGLPATADNVYAWTLPRIRDKNAEYRHRYPDDVARLRRIADTVATGRVRLPDGDLPTVRRIARPGPDVRHGGRLRERVHWLLDEALDARSGELSDTFLPQVMNPTGFVDQPAVRGAP